MTVAGGPGLDLQLARNKTAGSSDGCLHQFVGIRDLIHQSSLKGHLRFNGFADSNHLQGITQADKARQALGSAGPRDKADLNFRLSQVDALDGRPIMTAHGKFQPTAQTVAVDSRHHGLGPGFDLVHKLYAFHHPGDKCCFVLQMLNFGDIRPGDEIFTGSGQDDGFYSAVTIGLAESLCQISPKLGRQLIDRRIVHGEHGHIVPHFHLDCLVVRFHTSNPFPCPLFVYCNLLDTEIFFVLGLNRFQVFRRRRIRFQAWRIRFLRFKPTTEI